MTLSKERQGEIALQILLHEAAHKGMTLKVGENKREIHNKSKQLGIPDIELAEFYKILISSTYEKVVTEVDEAIKNEEAKLNN